MYAARAGAVGGVRAGAQKQSLSFARRSLDAVEAVEAQK